MIHPAAPAFAASAERGLRARLAASAAWPIGLTLWLTAAAGAGPAFGQATDPELTAPDAPADGRPAASPDGAGAGDDAPTQFSKNTSPSGLALGVLDKDVDPAGLPAEVDALAKAGALASADQDWEKARGIYEKMVQLAPRNALAYANLGVVEYQLANYEAARTALRRSLQINPNIAQNWLTLGLVYYREKNHELAIASLARALHQDPKDPRSHLYMAIVIHDYGWGPAAEIELQRAIELDPAFADAHFNLALMYLEKAPPALELARRHYYAAVDLGAKPDPAIEKQLKAPDTPASPPADPAPAKP